MSYFLCNEVLDYAHTIPPVPLASLVSYSGKNTAHLRLRQLSTDRIFNPFLLKKEKVTLLNDEFVRERVSVAYIVVDGPGSIIALTISLADG